MENFQSVKITESNETDILIKKLEELKNEEEILIEKLEELKNDDDGLLDTDIKIVENESDYLNENEIILDKQENEMNNENKNEDINYIKNKNESINKKNEDINYNKNKDFNNDLINEKLKEMEKIELNFNSNISRERKIKILETQTYTRGSNLSGGFQQSVALARVFVKPQSKFIICNFIIKIKWTNRHLQWTPSKKGKLLYQK
jgi:hypothetical protein